MIAHKHKHKIHVNSNFMNFKTINNLKKWRKILKTTFFLPLVIKENVLDNGGVL